MRVPIMRERLASKVWKMPTKGVAVGQFPEAAGRLGPGEDPTAAHRARAGRNLSEVRIAVERLPKLEPECDVDFGIEPVFAQFGVR